jgi:golgin subfamily A member 4
MKFILDIEKLISDESRLIYVGDKAKYITGADKLPDFLRLYIANMKKSAE